MENRFTKNLERHVRHLIQSYVPEGESLLLGYSGGPDSEALLQLFFASKLSEKYTLHLVHVDHGWREESKREAEVLKRKTASLDCPFHLFQLESQLAVGNLENWSRDKRFEIFQKVAQQVQAFHLLLAHHQDDSTEVSLKRMMEGSHLIHLSGIEEKSSLGPLTVLRPLLKIKKEDLLTYLRLKGIEWLDDRTNVDTRFLRASMRQVLLPFLGEVFKKNIRPSLAQLSDEALLLKEHVHEELQKSFTYFRSENALFCAPHTSSRFLLLQALHESARSFRTSLSREQEMGALEVLSRKRNCSIALSNKDITLYVDKKSFLIIKGQQLIETPKELVIDKEGEYSFGSFSIRVSRKPFSQAASFLALFDEGFCFEVDHFPLKVVPTNEKNMGAFAPKGAYMFQLPTSIRKRIPLFIQETCVALPYREWKKNIHPSGETIFVSVVR